MYNLYKQLFYIKSKQNREQHSIKLIIKQVCCVVHIIKIVHILSSSVGMDEITVWPGHSYVDREITCHVRRQA